MDRCDCGLGCIQVAAFPISKGIDVSISCSDMIKSEVTHVNKGFEVSVSKFSKGLIIATNYQGGIKSICSLVCDCSVGLYEPFVPCDQDFILADGGTFNVLRR